MKLSKITIGLGKTIPNPKRSFANDKIYVELEVDIEAEDDTSACFVKVLDDVRGKLAYMEDMTILGWDHYPSGIGVTTAKNT